MQISPAGPYTYLNSFKLALEPGSEGSRLLAQTMPLPAGWRTVDVVRDYLKHLKHPKQERVAAAQLQWKGCRAGRCLLAGCADRRLEAGLQAQHAGARVNNDTKCLQPTSAAQATHVEQRRQPLEHSGRHASIQHRQQAAAQVQVDE